MNTSQETIRRIFAEAAAALKDSPTVCYALYSPSAALEFGSSIYLSTDGKTEVEVTCVGKDPKWLDENYLWPDAYLVGTVTKWLRRGQPDNSRSWLDMSSPSDHLPKDTP